MHILAATDAVHELEISVFPPLLERPSSPRSRVQANNRPTEIEANRFQMGPGALDFIGGAGFFRSLGLERLFRDVQGVRYHPLRGAAQRRYTGRLALGVDVND